MLDHDYYVDYLHLHIIDGRITFKDREVVICMSSIGALTFDQNKKIVEINQNNEKYYLWFDDSVRAKEVFEAIKVLWFASKNPFNQINSTLLVDAIIKLYTDENIYEN